MMRRSMSRRFALLASFTLCLVGGIPAGQVLAQDPFQVPSNEPPAESRKAGAAEKKTAAKEPERVVKTLEQWQKQLTHEQFLVTRMKATEPAFSGKYATGHWKGNFLCVCCGARLFDSRHKFDSGTGWPSFDRPAGDRALETAWDFSEAEARVEVTCRRCGAHLGHVFQDGPTATGLRYCINSLAIKLDSEKPTPAPARKTARPQAARSGRVSPRSRRPAPPSTEKAARDESSEPRS